MVQPNAQQVAADEVRAITAALLAPGGAATVAAICEGSGLTTQAVQRRLMRNGPAMIRVESRYFSRNRTLWGLTDVGRAAHEKAGQV